MISQGIIDIEPRMEMMRTQQIEMSLKSTLLCLLFSKENWIVLTSENNNFRQKKIPK